MSLDPDLLYSWLPAHVRIRDREEGEPLRALMAVAEELASELHDDVGRLYRNWFIETSQEWVVPYVGDLVGIARLRAMNPTAYTLRAYVANAIALRRRKGTPAAMEQVAQDLTGWHASVLEMFQQVSTTQHIKHPRPGSVRTPSLRNANEMDRLYGPFERASHTLDVRGLNRAPEPGLQEAVSPPTEPVKVLTQRDRGRYNLQTVSVFLWRLRAWPVTLAPAVPHEAQDGETPYSWYHFNQLGRDLPLFNFPQTKLEAASLAQEHHLPGQLRRSALYLELEARRQAEVDGVDPLPAWFGDQPPFRIYTRGPSGGLKELSPSGILIANLARCGEPGWLRPPGQRTYYPVSGGTVQKPITALVDPELGRLVFTPGNEPAASEQVLVSYHYGFSSDVGGGTYERHAELPDRPGFSHYPVHADAGPAAGLRARIIQWLAETPNTPGAVIEVLDNAIHAVDPDELSITVPEGKHLELRAANRQRPVISLSGDLHITLERHASLTLNGLWLHGGDVVVSVAPEGPTAVSLVHCTLVPETPGHPGARLRIVAAGGGGEGDAAPMAVSCTVRRSIVGGLELGGLGADCVLDFEESIADHRAGTAIHHGGAMRARASTVLGNTRVDVLELASDMLFTGTVMSERRQTGCARFSYAPPDSELPPRFQCQPQLPDGTDAATREAILYRLNPRFTSVVYGQPGYCQLAANMPDEVLRGASDEGEMGVFHHLEQSQRALNLQTGLSEYLRLGLEAGLIFVT
ncbi:phage tail protein [Pyxidicoccus xibeiensis]|uniref:phage tail protein n=1 Tax=Pyxidicoccus xibeiensis TaxID=2906759 RepID=UPI0020A79BA3|nr:phage tail protein [Pyxidicoccus xibeiensis]MCP3137401.1 phage tail protein [Pyxidicoccus xibeiensis]